MNFNEIRLFGILLLVVGVCLMIFVKEDLWETLAGFLAGAGLVISITGRLRSKR